MTLVLPGDFNGDGIVDAADYVIWRKNDGSQVGYDMWRSHFGQTASGNRHAGGSGSHAAAPPSRQAWCCYCLRRLAGFSRDASTAMAEFRCRNKVSLWEVNDNFGRLTIRR